jgi:hypothetical protein
VPSRAANLPSLPPMGAAPPAFPIGEPGVPSRPPGPLSRGVDRERALRVDALLVMPVCGDTEMPMRVPPQGAHLMVPAPPKKDSFKR